jgi:hypothetical protein
MDDMKNAVLYVHGKGGSATECEHYRPLFPTQGKAEAAGSAFLNAPLDKTAQRITGQEPFHKLY